MGPLRLGLGLAACSGATRLERPTNLSRPHASCTIEIFWFLGPVLVRGRGAKQKRLAVSPCDR